MLGQTAHLYLLLSYFFLSGTLLISCATLHCPITTSCPISCARSLVRTLFPARGRLSPRYGWEMTASFSHTTTEKLDFGIFELRSSGDLQTPTRLWKGSRIKRVGSKCKSLLYSWLPLIGHVPMTSRPASDQTTYLYIASLLARRPLEGPTVASSTNVVFGLPSGRTSSDSLLGTHVASIHSSRSLFVS